MKPSVIIGAALAAAAVLFLLLVPHWSAPPVYSTNYGPPGTEMVVFKDSRAKPTFAPQPELIPAAAAATRSAGGYRNVQVLGGLTPAEFDRTMAAMTQWVSPKEGCGFCHNGSDYAAENPHKAIARQMLRMVRTVNANWTNHVGVQGVTCYTCHRGNNVPSDKWYLDSPRSPPEGGIIGKPQEWDTDAKTIREFFPNRPNRMFLLEGLPAHSVEAHQALVTKGPSPFPHDRDYTEEVYVMMMQTAEGLGVNCTYCHNSRSLSDWSQSPPQRLAGYSGIKMTTMINQNFLAPLAPWTDHALLGKMGDAPKIDCKSCHGGQQQPPGGMLVAYYPGLVGPIPTGPANPVAAGNPTIPQLTAAPKVGSAVKVAAAP